MPNWVQNYVDVKADRKTCREIREFVKGTYEDGGETDFDFVKIVPYPRELAEAIKNEPVLDNGVRYMVDGEYDFCSDHWGTKWNACRVELDTDLDEENPAAKDSDSAYLSYRFETAWGAPWGCLEALSKKFPDVTFEIMAYDMDDFSPDNFSKGVFKNGKYTCDFKTPEERRQMFIDEVGGYEDDVLPEDEENIEIDDKIFKQVDNFKVTVE